MWIINNSVISTSGKFEKIKIQKQKKTTVGEFDLVEMREVPSFLHFH